jgi:hypothetical protein
MHTSEKNMHTLLMTVIDQVAGGAGSYTSPQPRARKIVDRDASSPAANRLPPTAVHIVNSAGQMEKPARTREVSRTLSPVPGCRRRTPPAAVALLRASVCLLRSARPAS